MTLGLAAGIGIVFVLSIMAGILFLQHVKKDASNTFLAAIFFVPAIFVWVADKDLAEFGVASVYAKFNTILHQPTNKVYLNQKVASLTPPADGISPASPQGECAPYLVLQTNNIPSPRSKDRNEYIVEAAAAIGSSLACGKLRGVVVLDGKGRYNGSFDANFFAEAVSLWTAFDPYTSGKGHYEPRKLTREEYAFWADKILKRTVFGPALITPLERIDKGDGFFTFVKESDTVRYAWRELRRSGGSFLAVTDGRHNVKNVLTSDQLADLLLDMLARVDSVRDRAAR